MSNYRTYFCLFTIRIKNWFYSGIRILPLCCQKQCCTCYSPHGVSLGKFQPLTHEKGSQMHGEAVESAANLRSTVTVTPTHAGVGQHRNSRPAAAGVNRDPRGCRTVLKSKGCRGCSHPTRQDTPIAKKTMTGTNSQTNDSHQNTIRKGANLQLVLGAAQPQPVSHPDSCSPGVVQAGWGSGPTLWYQIELSHQVPFWKTQDKDNCTEEGLVQGQRLRLC